MEEDFQFLDNKLKIILAINSGQINIRQSKSEVREQTISLGLHPDCFNKIMLWDLTESRIKQLTKRRDELALISAK